MSNDDLLPVRGTCSGYGTGVPAITKENFTCVSTVVAWCGFARHRKPG